MTLPRRRICVLFHESEVLGASVSILRAIDELRRSGCSCSGWFPGPGPLIEASSASLANVGMHEKPLAFSLSAWRRPPGVATRLRRTPAYLRVFAHWLAADAPDIVHANSLLMLPEATLAHRRGLPVVVQVHELPPQGRKRDLSIRWAAAVADVLVGVSEPVTAMLRAHAGVTPVLTIHNGVPAAQPARPREGEFIVGSIGHISRTKGTDVFLEAARLALELRPELRFEHVGPARLWGDDVYDRCVDELVAAPALRGRVAMLGRRPAAEALARWSLFVFASRQEAFPLSTLEAMAAGVPVIATAVGGLPEQIDHLRTGILVPTPDPQVLARWIVRLHDDDQLRSRIAREARERVRQEFTVHAQADALDDVYREVIARSARRPFFQWFSRKRTPTLKR